MQSSRSSKRHLAKSIFLSPFPSPNNRTGRDLHDRGCLQLCVLIEVAALTGYGLIAMGGKRAAAATFNYAILGTIGASLYLLGVGYLYIKTGSLNMVGINEVIASGDALKESASMQVAFVLVCLGILIKMAFFPLHAWLPNAYCHAPTATSCLLRPW